MWLEAFCAFLEYKNYCNYSVINLILCYSVIVLCGFGQKHEFKVFATAVTSVILSLSVWKDQMLCPGSQKGITHVWMESNIRSRVEKQKIFQWSTQFFSSSFVALLFDSMFNLKSKIMQMPFDCIHSEWAVMSSYFCHHFNRCFNIKNSSLSSCTISSVTIHCFSLQNRLF